MTAETDRFVVASFALWAGDVAYLESLLRDYPREQRTFRSLEAVEEPEEIIRIAAELRVRQLAQKRGEFNRAVEYPLGAPRMSISDRPIVIETTHLRGTVWRAGLRDFLLQGYLSSLGWETNFFDRVNSLAQPSAVSSSSPQDLIEPEPAAESANRIGGAWAIQGNPFVQVEVTDMGLFEANALWTGQDLPREFGPIRQAFRMLLESLDEPTDTAH